MHNWNPLSNYYPPLNRPRTTLYKIMILLHSLWGHAMFQANHEVSCFLCITRSLLSHSSTTVNMHLLLVNVTCVNWNCKRLTDMVLVSYYIHYHILPYYDTFSSRTPFIVFIFRCCFRGIVRLSKAVIVFLAQHVQAMFIECTTQELADVA